MVRKNTNSKALLISRVSVLIVVMLLLCFRQAPGDSSAFMVKDPNTLVDIMTRRMDRRKDRLKEMLFRGPAGNFETSLKMKENVDFLLTPALLVQEVISDDVVITYPSE